MIAAAAVTKAIQTKYDTLALAIKPKLNSNAVPATAGPNAVTAAPTAKITVQDAGTQYLSDTPPLETVRVTLTAVFPSGAEAAAWADGVQYGGQPRTAFAGLDNCRSLPLPAGWALDVCVRLGPPVLAQEPKTGVATALLSRVTLVYRVRVYQPD